MKTKILSLFLLTAILSLAMVSGASLTIDNVVGNESSVYQDEDSFQITFDLINTGVEADINWSNSIINEASAGASFSFSQDHIDEDETLNIITTITFDDSYVGTISGTIEADPSGAGDSKTFDFSVEILESTTPSETFCSLPNKESGLKIKKVRIKNHGPSEDGEDNKWFPLDRIEVEVELENNGNDEIEDIVFQLGLFEKDSSTDIAEDMLWISDDDEEIEIGDIEEKGEDDELKHTFEFRVNPEDLEKGDYYLKIKAYSDDLGENNVCIDYADDLADSDFGSSEYYAEIDINKEEEDEGRAVVVDVEELNGQINAQCSDIITLNVDVWNICDENQDQIKINLYNQELGINQDYTIRDDVDEGDDKQEVEFTFTIPKDAEEKTYTLEFRTYYDYDDDDDTYDEYSDTFKTFLKVAGNCQVEISEPQITAELDSETPEAIAGKQVIIKSTIKNTADVETTYLISIFGNSAWSNQKSIEPQSITLKSGESKDVNILLDIDADAQGDKEFTIKVDYNEQTTEQKVALSIEKSAGQDAVITHLKNNWFIYLIALINIILIIAIIAVVKSMVGKNPAVI